MLNFIKSGVTTVLVSHDLQAIEGICNRVICLDHGEMVAEGEPNRVIPKYRVKMI